MLSSKEILIIGDTCNDHIIEGDVRGISPEGPIPVLVNPVYSFSRGMAYNFIRNIESLLGEKVKNTILNNYPSDIWNYIDKKSGYKLLRMDKVQNIVPPLSFKEVEEKINRDIKIIVVLDYDSGYITNSLLKEISDNFEPYCNLYLDTRKDCLNGLDDWVIKINDEEYSKAEKNTKNIDDFDIICTYGRAGAGYGDSFIDQRNKIDARDVTGCGETFLSTFIYFIHNREELAKLTGEEFNRYSARDNAIDIANLAASITAGHLGTYAPTKEEIENLYRKVT